MRTNPKAALEIKTVCLAEVARGLKKEPRGRLANSLLDRMVIECYVYMYVCMYVCMYVYVCIYIDT
jgi:hypothetical protein